MLHSNPVTDLVDALAKAGEAVANMWIGSRSHPTMFAGKRPATVITGASEGIGLELAKVICKEGRSVLCVSRRAAKLDRAVKLLEDGESGNVITLALDVSREDAPQAIEDCLRQHGLYLDVLVNNAGIGCGGEFAEVPADQIDKILLVNVMATTRLTRHFLPAMKARRRGGVLNIASLAGCMPGPWQSVYFASKAYLLSLTASIAAECAGSGVRICAIACGPVDTNIHQKMGTTTTLYLQLLPTVSPAAMAARCWRAYRLGRCIAIPGLLNRIAACVLGTIPRRMASSIVGFLMRPGSMPDLAPRSPWASPSIHRIKSIAAARLRSDRA